ncbi:hypothetical protein M9Y10_003753 [Tritrichomonas musculus]|uniref:Uncharacterized protein n=1 Tax=Tritrichomonas musculus TaxID=1915356 RepID=A0ABR2JS39_9EUKA
MRQKFNINSNKKVPCFIKSLRKESWKTKLSCNSFHLHSFASLKENPLSNYFLLRQFNPPTDILFKFVLKGLLNYLGTPEIDELFRNVSHAPCPSCLNHGHNHIQSLKHILNGCVSRYRQYTERHNRLQFIILEYIRILSDVEDIYCDRSIQMDGLPDNLRLLRPDIVVWHNNRNKCTLFEINVPHAYTNWGDDSLKKVCVHKLNKYRELMEFLRSRNIEVQIYPVIVSWCCIQRHYLRPKQSFYSEVKMQNSD